MTEFMFLNVAYRATVYRIGISIFDRITNLTISRELAIDIRIQIQVYPYFGPIVEKKEDHTARNCCVRFFASDFKGYFKVIRKCHV